MTSSADVADLNGNIFRRTIFFVVMALILSGGILPPPPPHVPQEQKKPGLNRVKCHSILFSWYSVFQTKHVSFHFSLYMGSLFSMLPINSSVWQTDKLCKGGEWLYYIHLISQVRGLYFKLQTEFFRSARKNNYTDRKTDLSK